MCNRKQSPTSSRNEDCWKRYVASESAPGPIHGHHHPNRLTTLSSSACVTHFRMTRTVFLFSILCLAETCGVSDHKHYILPVDGNYSASPTSSFGTQRFRIRRDREVLDSRIGLCIGISPSSADHPPVRTIISRSCPITELLAVTSSPTISSWMNRATLI